MPRTQVAGAVSAAYRAHLAQISQQTQTAVVNDLAAADTSLPIHQLAGWLASWEDRAATTVLSGQQQAATLTGAYLPAYLAASDVPDPDAGLDQVDTTAHVGVASAAGIGEGQNHQVAGLLASASVGLIWALGQGRTPEAAAAYGQGIARRTAATATASAATSTLTDLMVASPVVTGWERLVHDPTCSRCAHWARRGEAPPGAKMWRHPNCDCTQEPVVAGHSPLVRAAPTVDRP
jgi:hypothetical protein